MAANDPPRRAGVGRAVLFGAALLGPIWSTVALVALDVRAGFQLTGLVQSAIILGPGLFAIGLMPRRPVEKIGAAVGYIAIAVIVALMLSLSYTCYLDGHRCP